MPVFQPSPCAEERERWRPQHGHAQSGDYAKQWIARSSDGDRVLGSSDIVAEYPRFHPIPRREGERARPPGANLLATAVEVRPVTPDRWDDLLRVFGPNGARGGCWCMVWRLSSTELRRTPAAARRERLEALVAEGTPTGLLAYVDGAPVGWCSVGPRETFGRLVRSRTLPHADERPAWAITCFYVRAGFRRRGVASALVHGAAAPAADKRRGGARRLCGPQHGRQARLQRRHRPVPRHRVPRGAQRVDLLHRDAPSPDSNPRGGADGLRRAAQAWADALPSSPSTGED